MTGIGMGGTGARGGVGGWTTGGISKDTGGGGSGGSISHGCSNASGNVVGGMCGIGRSGGKGTLLSTRSTMEGGAVASLALICHTERKLASVLHVAKASSYKQWNCGDTLAVVVLRTNGTLDA